MNNDKYQTEKARNLLSNAIQYNSTPSSLAIFSISSLTPLAVGLSAARGRVMRSRRDRMEGGTMCFSSSFSGSCAAAVEGEEGERGREERERKYCTGVEVEG